MRLRNVLLSPWAGGTPRALCKALGLVLVTPRRLEKRDIRLQAGHLFNWGCHNTGKVHWTYRYNHDQCVRVASSKLSTLRALLSAKIPTVEFTEHDEQARAWHKEASVIGHFDLHAHSGEGLYLFKKGEAIDEAQFADCELYTKYFPKKREVRIHVIRVGRDKWVHLFLEKKRVLSDRYQEFGITGAPTTYIRTHKNGWIFARDVVEDPTAAALGIETIRLLGLDYGAVDILIKDKECRVGEVNTAPGLEGQALEFYVENFKTLLNPARVGP